jgi:hypothetical protein
VTAVRPGSRQVSKVGGSNASGRFNVSSSYEFWHNGSNHPADDYGYDTVPDMGRWRIEIRPQSQLKNHIFINVLQPCAKSESRVPVSYITGNTGQSSEMQGVHIKDSAQPCVALFSKSETKGGGLIDEVDFTVNDSGIIYVLIGDMEANTYNIYQNGSVITDSPKTVYGGNNALFFRVANGGTFSITVGEPDDPPPAPPTDVHFE